MLDMEDDKKGITVISLDKIGALIVYITDEGDHLIKCIKVLRMSFNYANSFSFA